MGEAGWAVTGSDDHPSATHAGRRNLEVGGIADLAFIPSSGSVGGRAATKQRIWLVHSSQGMMLPSSNGLLQVPALIAIAMTCAPGDLSAQAPSFAEVMSRAHTFVVEYEDDLSTVVAEEQYEQQVLNNEGELKQERVLNSDYRVTQLLPHEFWLGVREVFEVDGRVVRERTTRPLRALRLSPGEDASERLRRIAEDNARFNIGDVVRTFNEPTFALAFLHPRNRDRMRFVQLGEERVGRVSTWVVGYREQPSDGTSFIETQNGDHLLTRGRFWIDPTTGRVLGNVVQFRIEGLVNGAKYFVVVRAYIAAGVRSIHSDEASGVAGTSSGVDRR